MRVLLDYRPALKERTGVGEYAHQLARALLAAFPAPGTAHGEGALELSLFSSSWKDRLPPAADLAGAIAIDRRVPGKVLNFAWHRLGWPPAERITGRAFDVTHSLHPCSCRSAIARLIDDQAFAAVCVTNGLERSRQFSWDRMARDVYAAYRRAIERRCVSA